MRQKLSLTSKLYCCSLTISGPPPAQLSRSYSTNFFAGSRSSKAENVNFYSKRPSSDLVNKYLQSLTGQSTLKKFEPCYRPLYPSKKCAKPTYKIPRKLPYIPAVFLKRKKPVIKYQKPTQATRKDPTLVQWPPLYKCKKRDVEPKSQEARPKTGNLPPWLLPLYSYKAGRPYEMVGLAEASYCGGAFHRRMEFLQGVKVIRDKQQSLTNRKSEESGTKEVFQKKPFISKSAAAVNDLKIKIGEMYAKMGSMKRSESFQRTQLIIKESEIAEGEKDRSNDGGNSKQLYSNSKYPIKIGVVADDSIRTHPKSSAAASQRVVNKVSGYNFLSSINPRQVDPQPPVSLQSSTETQGTPNPKAVLEPRTVDFKLSSDSQPMEPSTIPHTTPGRKDQSSMKMENTVVDNEWSVQSLKSRINDMLTIEEEKLKRITSKYKEVISVQKPNSDGVRAHVSRPSSRSFHRCCIKTVESKLRTSNVSNRGDAHSVGIGLQLRSKCRRSYVGRRSFSTFSVSKTKERPSTFHSIYRRNSNQATKFPVKKTNWITRIRRCFVIKRDKGVRVEDWKKTPRKTPCCVKDESKTYSPSPVLWIDKEKSAEQYQTENPEVRSNPAVLNAEQRIMASINRIEPAPIPKIRRTGSEEPVDSRLSEIEKKVRKAEMKVNILPFPWPDEVKSCSKVAKRPELCSQDEKLSGSMFTAKEETGYEWILNNKKIVEDIKYRRRQFAGKPLVPSHVKQSIEEYKLPLRAQISQYRKSIERRAHGLYSYSTARRWYSATRYSRNSQPTILQRSSMSGSGARNLSNNASPSSETPSLRTQLEQIPSRTVLVGSKFYKTYALRPTYGDSSRNDRVNHLARDPNSTRKRGNLKMRTKVFPLRQAAPLTSPNKMVHKGPETSSVSMKKQVDDLKRLIRKSKGLDNVPEKEGEVHDQSKSNECYEMKLRKLVRTAQANTKKLKFVEPKYHSKNCPSIERRGISPESVRAPESVKSDSSTSSPFPSELEQDSRIESKTLKMKQQISQSVSLDSFHRNKKPFSRMYLRLKSFVASVRRKSTQETNNPRIIPSNKLKASTSLCSFVSSEPVKKDGPKEIDTINQVVEDSSSSAPVAFELCYRQVATPANSIQLWKTKEHVKRSVKPGTSKPADVEDLKFVGDQVPSDHGDLMSMLSRAKELITFHSQSHVEELANTAKIMGNNSAEVKSSTKISETAVGQINANCLGNKTRFWPVLPSLPQSVLDETDQGGANDGNSTVDKDTHKTCHYDQNSFSETVMAETASYGPTLNSHCMYGNQDNKTCLIKEVNRETNEPSRLAAALEEPIQALTGTYNPLISEAYNSVEPYNRVAMKPEVNSENLQDHNPNTETGRFDLTYNRNCLDELVDPSNTNSSECQTIVPGDSGVASADVEPKRSHAGQSALNGVSSGKWELFSRTIKTELPQVDASNAKHIEHEPCAPYLVVSKENVTCEEEATENQQIVHTGNQDAGRTPERSGICEFSSPLNSYVRSHSVLSQMPDTQKSTAGNTTAEEEVKLHYDEMKSPDRSTITELLGKDPNINPELVKKLKLPVLNPEGSSEKTWCTRPQNNLSNV